MDFQEKKVNEKSSPARKNYKKYDFYHSYPIYY